MPELATAYVSLVPSLKGAQGTIAQELGGIGQKAGGGAGSGFKGAFMGALGGLAAGIVGAVGVGSIVSGFKAAISEASNLNESLNAVNVTYGANAEGVKQLGREAATALGLSNNEFNSLAVRFSSFASTIAGPGGDVVGTLDDITTRASDFASVMNLEVADAAALFQSGLAGETEPLRQYGIDLSAAAVENYALANGIAASAGSMTEAQKVQARYGLLMQSTQVTQGDFANTSTSLANASRILGASWDNVTAKLGSSLLPGLGAAVNFLAGTAVPAFSAFIDRVSGIGTAMDAGASFSEAFSASGIGQAIVGGLQGAFQAAVSFLSGGGLTTILQGVLAFRTTLMSGIASALPGVVSSIAAVIPQVVGAIAGALPQIVTVVLGLVPLLLGALTTLLGSIGSALVTVVPQIVGTITTLLPALILALVSMLPALITAALGLFNGLITALVTVIPMLITSLVGAIPMIIMAIVGALPALIQGAVSLFLGLVTGLVTALPAILSAVLGAIPMLIGAIVSMIPALIDGAVSLFLGLILGLAQAIPQVVSAIIGAIPQLVQALIRSVPLLIQGAITLFLGLVQGLGRATPQIVDAVIGMIPQLVGAVVGAVPQLLNAGTQLIQGLIRGIQSQASRIAQAILGPVQGGIDAVKNFLGIRSPSRYMDREVGQQIIEGAAIGAEKKKRRYQRAVLDSLTPPDVGSFVPVGAYSVGRAVPGAAVSSLEVGGGGFPDTVKLVDQDGSILARARVVADEAVASNGRRRGLRYANGIQGG